MIPTLKEKTVLITGATDGLGKETAKRVAAAGATVLLHGRNKTKGASVKEEIVVATGNEAIYYYNADFSSLQEVKQLSEEVLSNHSSLHVLINNAAIGGGPKGEATRELSKDGYELRFAVNHLSHFLLTQNLLSHLKASAPARVVNVSSIGQSPLNFDDLQLEKRYQSFDAYCKSKLAQVLYGFSLAETLKDAGIAVNSLHPATLMDTNMVHRYFGKVSATVAEGADAVMQLVFAEDTAGVTGAFFNQFTEARANTQAYDEAARKKLWQASEAMTKAYLIT